EELAASGRRTEGRAGEARLEVGRARHVPRDGPLVEHVDRLDFGTGQRDEPAPHDFDLRQRRHARPLDRMTARSAPGAPSYWSRRQSAAATPPIGAKNSSSISYVVGLLHY